MICSQCGRCHAHQVVDYPIDSIVVVIVDFVGGIDINKYKPFEQSHGRVKIPAGSLGYVIGHCDDGWAMIEFEAEQNKNCSTHSFHHPEEFFRLPLSGIQKRAIRNGNGR